MDVNKIIYSSIEDIFNKVTDYINKLILLSGFVDAYFFFEDTLYKVFDRVNGLVLFLIHCKVLDKKEGRN